MAFNWYDEIQSIVLDNGSGSIKIGIAGDDAPQSIFPNIIGDPRHATILPETLQTDSFIGDKALKYRDILNLRYPMEHGIVTNWDDMEKVWHYLFHHKLRLSTANHPIVVSEVPLNPIGNREKMTQILFERFQVPGRMLYFLSNHIHIFFLP